ncbi:MAG: hypothetical protein IPL47_07680 [Phyllobacteriaceae bacterium]|nr:hypothetical protein [Phyllobacteriaceae bacterium]
MALAIAVPFGPVFAEESIISQDISGFSLPGVQMPQGADEVRAADGTTCRSAVGNSGAYLDVGLMGKPGGATKDVSAYGRVVVPLGRTPKRLNCAQLYELEVERLKMELQLMKMGLGSQGRMEDIPSEAALGPSVGDETASVTISDEEAPVEKPKKAKASKTAAKQAAIKPAGIKSAKTAESDWIEDGWTTKGRKN